MPTIETIAGQLQTLGLRFQESDGRLVIPFKADDTSYRIQIVVDGPLVRLVAGDLLPIPERRMGEVLNLVTALAEVELTAAGLDARRLAHARNWVHHRYSADDRNRVILAEPSPLETVAL